MPGEARDAQIHTAGEKDKHRVTVQSVPSSSSLLGASPQFSACTKSFALQRQLVESSEDCSGARALLCSCTDRCQPGAGQRGFSRVEGKTWQVQVHCKLLDIFRTEGF